MSVEPYEEWVRHHPIEDYEGDEHARRAHWDELRDREVTLAEVVAETSEAVKRGPLDARRAVDEPGRDNKAT